MTVGTLCVPTIVPLRVPADGKSKFAIDTNTRVELRCADPKAVIYYTTNGTRPDPFHRHGYVSKTTQRYSVPFTLPEGKITVKVLAALHSNGQESAVNTKVLMVSYADAKPLQMEDDENNFKKELSFFQRRPFNHSVSWSASFPKGLDSQRNDYAGPSLINDQPPSTIIMRYKCPFCQEPVHSYNSKCNRCGHPGESQPTDLNDFPEKSNQKMCWRCDNIISLHLNNCPHCDSMQFDKNYSKAQKPMSHKEIDCSVCETINPSYRKSCLECGTPLLDLTGTHSQNFISHKTLANMCLKCGKQVTKEASYCDGCGSAILRNPEDVICSKCSGKNTSGAKYCLYCGAYMVNHIPSYKESSQIRQKTSNTLALNNRGNWTPVSVPVKQFTQLKTAATQTVGINYFNEVNQPRSNLKVRHSIEHKYSHIEDNSFDKVVVGKCSAGKGYWKQNLEHVNNHVKQYAQNNSTFRASIGKQKIGVLKVGTLREEKDDIFINLQFSRGTEIQNKKQLSSKKEIRKRRQNKSSRRSSSSSSSDTTSRDGMGGDEVDNGSFKQSEHSSRRLGSAGISQINKLLIKAVHENQMETVETLLLEGANPNTEDLTGVPLLIAAIKNNFQNMTQLLLKNGADPNKKFGSHGLTPLHEAVKQGDCEEGIITSLLNHGADPRKRDNMGRTPYEYTIELGHETFATVLAAHSGTDAIRRYSMQRGR